MNNVSSEIFALCVVALWKLLDTEVSGKYFGPIFKKLGPIGCPEISANYCRSALHNMAEGRRPHWQCGGRMSAIMQRLSCDHAKTWWDRGRECDAGSVETRGNYKKKGHEKYAADLTALYLNNILQFPSSQTLNRPTCHCCVGIYSMILSRGSRQIHRYDVIWYLLTGIGFPPGGIGRQKCTKIQNKQFFTWGQTRRYKNTEHAK